jgi:hypothetical protein
LVAAAANIAAAPSCKARRRWIMGLFPSSVGSDK